MFLDGPLCGLNFIADVDDLTFCGDPLPASLTNARCHHPALYYAMMKRIRTNEAEVTRQLPKVLPENSGSDGSVAHRGAPCGRCCG